MMMVLMIPMGKFSRLRPVQSVKHIVDQQGGLVIGVTSESVLAIAVETPSLTDTNGVSVGSTVSSIFLNVQVASTTAAALSNVYMAVYKNQGGNVAPINPQAVGQVDNRRLVFHQEMIMVEKKVDGIPRTLFKGVIRIPRGYRRFGFGDELIITLRAPGVTMDFCIQTIYKEFR